MAPIAQLDSADAVSASASPIGAYALTRARFVDQSGWTYVFRDVRCAAVP